MLFPRRSLEASHNAQNIPRIASAQALSGTHRRHSSHIAPSVSTLQNQRVAAIIQGTGHSISSPAFTNRFHPIAQTAAQFNHASSAPSSVALHPLQQPRQRPQVPLFTQSTGSIHSKQAFPTQVQMAQDMDLFDDFPVYDMDNSVDTTSFPAIYTGGSPVVPTMYDAQSMARSSSSSTNVGTVSPQDLMVREPSFSAPNSTAFTNLTSPSMYNESPDFPDAYETSPMFTNTDMDPSTMNDPWFPLFPDASSNIASNVVEPSIEQSPLSRSEELEVAERRKSSQRKSSSGSPKAANTSGVSARKRNQPLPPIIVDDPQDTIAIKRARNTLAARKSRQKKMERFEELENEIEKLKEERDHWKSLALARSAAQN